MNENRCCICGAVLSDNNTSGIGFECLHTLNYAKKMSMNEDQKLQYNWYINADAIRLFFVDTFKDVKFRSDFKISFYESMKSAQRIWKS